MGRTLAVKKCEPRVAVRVGHIILASAIGAVVVVLGVVMYRGF